jgi:hypothetical protein
MENKVEQIKKAIRKKIDDLNIVSDSATLDERIAKIEAKIALHEILREIAQYEAFLYFRKRKRRGKK